MTKNSIPAYEEMLRKIFDDMKRWHNLYDNGGFDPICTDGMNLNIIRTQIDIDITSIKQYYPDKTLPENLTVPDQVPIDLMIKADEIKEQIPFAFQALFDHPDYLHLSESYECLSPSQKQKADVSVLRHKEWCMNAIEQGDLVGMRRYIYMDAHHFHDQCRKQSMKYDEILKQQCEEFEMNMEL